MSALVIPPHLTPAMAPVKRETGSATVTEVSAPEGARIADSEDEYVPFAAAGGAKDYRIKSLPPLPAGEVTALLAQWDKEDTEFSAAEPTASRG